MDRKRISAAGTCSHSACSTSTKIVIISPVRPCHRPVLTLAFPFAVLQAAQVLHLDGDLLVANAVLTPEEVGFVAVLSLIQRVQFFACFGLAAVLLPSVTAAALRGWAGLREAAPVAGLFGLVSLVVLGLIHLGAALVHQFAWRDRLLRRMWFGRAGSGLP